VATVVEKFDHWHNGGRGLVVEVVDVAGVGAGTTWIVVVVAGPGTSGCRSTVVEDVTVAGVVVEVLAESVAALVTGFTVVVLVTGFTVDSMDLSDGCAA
jgi:hypothetical protein